MPAPSQHPYGSRSTSHWQSPHTRTFDMLGLRETPPIERVLVYPWCMSRTNVDIDDRACAEVMRRYRLPTKRAAVNFALRTLAAEPLSLDEARSLRGSGWDGDLETLRSGRPPWS